MNYEQENQCTTTIRTTSPKTNVTCDFIRKVDPSMYKKMQTKRPPKMTSEPQKSNNFRENSGFKFIRYSVIHVQISLECVKYFCVSCYIFHVNYPLKA